VIIPRAGHFFDDRLDELKRAITEWADEQLTSSQS
jgi:alpha/beta superfamily hydrolase